MSDGFTLIIRTVLRKLNRKTMKRAFVQSGYKTLNNLFGNKFQRPELLETGLFDYSWQRVMI